MEFPSHMSDDINSNIDDSRFENQNFYKPSSSNTTRRYGIRLSKDVSLRNFISHYYTCDSNNNIIHLSKRSKNIRLYKGKGTIQYRFRRLLQLEICNNFKMDRLTTFKDLICYLKRVLRHKFIDD